MITPPTPHADGRTDIRRLLAALGIIFILTGSSSFAFALDIGLVIRETQGITRTDEMVHNGIPLAKEENITAIEELVIEDASGTQVPAAFEVLSRWAGGREDVFQPIQWLLVTFPASVDAHGSTRYFLRQGMPVAKSAVVSVTETAGDYTVNTGVAQFVISKTDLTFFDSIGRAGSVIAADNGGSDSMIHNQPEARALPPAQIVVERKNDHYMVIKVQGDYDNTPVGPASARPLSYKLRYEFFAGSPTAIINHKFFWPGYDGNASRGTPSADYFFQVDHVTLSVPDFLNYSHADVYADDTTAFTGSIFERATASLAQKRKELFTDPHRARITHGAATRETQFATRPMLINRSPDGALAVSIDHMQYFEPQSIATDADGKITIGVMAEPQYFANNQGTWARVGITALPPEATHEEALRLNYAPLHHRLIAFPENAYTSLTGVFNELPVLGESMDHQLNEYYQQLRGVTATTRRFLEDEGFHGLMVWGGLPRYNNPSEIGTGSGWDKIYSTGNLTDYHSTWNNVVYQFALEGDPSILYDLAFMGARRLLHTQIIQPDWENSSSYMGWGYAGYDRYRSDGNSCHSYFDNLFNYYYLTGDMEVIDILKAGGEHKRDSYTREDGQLNDPMTEGQSWVAHQGRIGSQFTRVFNFLGHVDPQAPHETDPDSFLQDYHHMFRHIFARSMCVENDELGIPAYAFFGDDLESGEVFTTGTQAEQNWMTALYSFNDLYRYIQEWEDREISVTDPLLGQMNFLPSDIYRALLRAFNAYLPDACNNEICSGGDGTWSGSWPNKVGVAFTGHRLNGTIQSVYPVLDGDYVLYSVGKALVTAHFLRAGAMFDDADLFKFGRDGLDYILSHETFLEAEENPWGKINGMLFANLHAAVTYLQGFAITTGALPAAMAGNDYLALLEAVQGERPYTWALAPGSAPLPEGLEISEEEGTITGVPAASPSTPQPFTFVVEVTDATGKKASADLSITLYSHELEILTPVFEEGQQGKQYPVQTLTAVNGVAPYTAWHVTAGSLPQGLSLGDDGAITGIPVACGTFSFKITVVDSQGNAAESGRMTITVVPATATALELSVARGSDDAEESYKNNTGWPAITNSSDLEMVNDNGYDQFIGIRFQSVPIPAGAIITHAYIQFTADESQSGPTSLFIAGQAHDNPDTFQEIHGSISKRQTTTSITAWENIPAWTTGQTYQSPGLNAIIQELVDRPGWQQGNAMVFIISGSGHRTAESRDKYKGSPALLHVDFK